MRHKKFKAWDKTNNEWYMGGDEFDLDFSGCYGDFFFDNDHPTNMREVELEWVQFTGLKDKNGKEIYEGDIVKQLTSGEHDKWARKIIVRWNNEWSGFYPFFTLSGHNREEIYEIIGNIYENPELL